jgi:hypothetical protein
MVVKLERANFVAEKEPIQSGGGREKKKKKKKKRGVPKKGKLNFAHTLERGSSARQASRIASET